MSTYLGRCADNWATKIMKLNCTNLLEHILRADVSHQVKSSIIRKSLHVQASNSQAGTKLVLHSTQHCQVSFPLVNCSMICRNNSGLSLSESSCFTELWVQISNTGVLISVTIEFSTGPSKNGLCLNGYI